MPATTAVSRASGGTPVLVRTAIALALPIIGAGTVAGTFFGKEVIVTAAWLALAVVGALFVRPVVGVAIMTTAFLLAAYPTVFQTLGILTLNNLIGLGLVTLLAVRILETRDFSFLRITQVRILIGIGVLLLIGAYVADWQFPLLQASRGRMYILDKSAAMGQDFLNRLVFLVFFCVFVRTRRDLKVMFLVFMLALYAAVPSALYNWMSGQLLRGFRAASSVTAGANPNRLGMICLIEMALFWYWAQARPGMRRQVVAFVAMAACVMVLMATGSRSAILGLVALGVILQTAPRAYRIGAPQFGMLAAVGALTVALFVPPETFSRMIDFTPTKGEVGASSNVMREETLERAWQMSMDYPLFGVGLGNFREVSRQVYKDKYYRPPHNSYLWAMSEGGLFVLAGYLLLFWVTWKDLQVTRRLAHRDPEIEVWACAIRAVFLLFFFYSLFADLWLNPIIYALLGLVISTRQYVESLPDVVPAVTPRSRWPVRVAR